MQGKPAGRVEKRVVCVLALMPEGSGTWHEIGEELKKRGKETILGSISPRWTNLRKLGLIEYHYDTNGNPITRINPKSKSPQEVQYITQKGRDVIPEWKRQEKELQEKIKRREEEKKAKKERKMKREQAKKQKEEKNERP
jgi:DNA-binding PadR family transcriptional regulator